MRKPLILILILCGWQGASQTNPLTVQLDQETRSMLREIGGDKWFKADVMVSTFLGGLLAIGGGFGASWYAHRLDARSRKREDKEFADNVLRATRAELMALSAVYEKGTGSVLATVGPGEFHPTGFMMSQKFFSVFESNAQHLGRVDPSLAEKVVRTYTLMKLMIEELRINNEYLDRYWRFDAEFHAKPGDPEAARRKETERERLVGHAVKLKGCESMLKSAMSELFQCLDQANIK